MDSRISMGRTLLGLAVLSLVAACASPQAPSTTPATTAAPSPATATPTTTVAPSITIPVTTEPTPEASPVVR